MLDTLACTLGGSTPSMLILLNNQTKIRCGLGLLLCCGFFLSGCLQFAVPDVETPDPRVSVPEPKPVIEAPVTAQIPKPDITYTLETEPVLTPTHIAVVVSDQRQSYASVLSAMMKWMEGRDYAVYDLRGSLVDAEVVLTQISERNTTAAIAVGHKAAILLAKETQIPVIFCQVFNSDTEILLKDHVRGVAVIPPLTDQIQAWLEVNPNLETIGTILGEGHQTLLDEAQSATATQDIEFVFKRAESDKEALYHFKRMAPGLDGFWLFPDNRILSESVIRQLLAYALRHRVQVTVFTPALLSQGAFMSAASNEQDVALQVLSILDQIKVDRIAQVPRLTPLNDIRIEFSSWVSAQTVLTADGTE